MYFLINVYFIHLLLVINFNIIYYVKLSFRIKAKIMIIIINQIIFMHLPIRINFIIAYLFNFLNTAVWAKHCNV